MKPFFYRLLSGLILFSGFSAGIFFCSSPRLPLISEEENADTEAFMIRYKSVLEFYSNPEDSLKLKAAEFLIRGLPYQFHFESHTLDLYDSLAKHQVQPSVTWLKNSLDSLQAVHGMSLVKQPDSSLVTDEYLIENIEYAFRAWELPWCKSLNFDQFCEYILPYKSGNEKPERWREKLWEEYQWVIESLPPGAGAAGVCKLINDSVEKWYTVNLEYNYPVDAGYTVSTWVTKGTCYGGSLMILYPLRAMGVPSTFDYVPRWANRSGDHNWNALYNQGQLITFNGPDRNPGVHKIEFIGVDRMFFRRPKVFRKTYAHQTGSLAQKIHPEEIIPDLFESPRIKDVTAEYIPISDIQIRAPGLKDRFVYLCTFDNANWKPVWWGEREKNRVTFYEMAQHVAYLPVRYDQEGYKVLGYPILLTAEGSLKIAKPSSWKTQTLRIVAKYPEDVSNHIFPGQQYELFYWDNQWISLGKQQAAESFLEYSNAPLNALFWIRNLDEGIQERIFTYENGKQIWY